MGVNVEIKARLSNPAETRAAVVKLADAPPEEIFQEDIFFHVPAGRLKLRKFATGASELIFYRRNNQQGPKLSNYDIFPTMETGSMENILSHALGIRGVVRKIRQLYRIGQTRVHLDTVEALGDFIELEVVLNPDQNSADGERIARRIMDELSITTEDLIDVAYVDLLTN